MCPDFRRAQEERQAYTDRPLGRRLHGRNPRPFLGVTVKSYSDTFPTSTVTDLTTGLTACPKFTITSKGQKTTYVASAM
jgi:hypothetical protein